MLWHNVSHYFGNMPPFFAGSIAAQDKTRVGTISTMEGLSREGITSGASPSMKLYWVTFLISSPQVLLFWKYQSSLTAM